MRIYAQATRDALLGADAQEQQQQEEEEEEEAEEDEMQQQHVEEQIEGAATGARANAGAAAEIAEERAELEAAADDAADEATEHVVTLTRASDGSLGLTIGSDDEGRPLVKVGRDGVLAGDIIVSLDGTEMFSTSQLEQEIRIRAQQGFALGQASTGDDDDDEVLLETIRLKLLRPHVIVQPVQWSTMAFTVSAGRKCEVPLVVQEAATGTFVFACADGGAIDFSLGVRPAEGAAAGGSAVTLVELTSTSRGEGSFRVGVPPHAAPCVLVCHLDNSAARVADVTLQCAVQLTPIRQAVAAETASTRAALAAQASHLEMLTRHVAGLRSQELELERKLLNMRVAREVAGEILEADSGVHEDLRMLTAALAAVHEEQEYGEEGEVEAALSASRQLRAAALEGRRTVRARAKEAEEGMMRAQVINLNLDEEGGDLSE